MNLHLKPANMEDWKAEYVAMQAMPEDSNGFMNRFCGMSEEEFRNKALPEMIKNTMLEPSEDLVPQTYLFLWDDDKIVGWFKFRHCLNGKLRTAGGHVGYGILPQYRGLGYATEGLQMVIELARRIVPEDELLLTCYKDNVVSRRVMEKNGAYQADENETYYYMQINLRKEQK